MINIKPNTKKLSRNTKTCTYFLYAYRDNVFKQESESEDEEEKLEMKSKYDLMLTDEKVGLKI